MTMKLEAAISLLKVRFDRICKNYALRIMQILKNHLIKLRISSSFLLYNNETELNWEKYLNRNEKNQSIITETVEISSESEIKQRHRKKKRKIKRKSKKKLHNYSK